MKTTPRYYIFSTYEGDIKGTNSQEDAELFALTEEYSVVDTETNEWILSDITRVQVEELDRNNPPAIYGDPEE